MISALLEKNSQQMNDEALRTFMCEAEAVFSRTLTTDAITSPGSAGALTPNHFLTMKTKVVLPPPGDFKSADLYSRKMVATSPVPNQRILEQMEERISSFLQERQKWTRPRKNLQVNDVVIVKEDDAPRNQWKACGVVLGST